MDAYSLVDTNLSTFRSCCVVPTGCLDVLAISKWLDKFQASLAYLARHLQYRNQEVVFLYSSGAAGLPFVPGPEKDQPGVAARIADKKIGAVTSLDELTAGHLSTLLDEVLNNSTYRIADRGLLVETSW